MMICLLLIICNIWFVIDLIWQASTSVFLPTACQKIVYFQYDDNKCLKKKGQNRYHCINTFTYQPTAVEPALMLNKCVWFQVTVLSLWYHSFKCYWFWIYVKHFQDNILTMAILSLNTLYNAILIEWVWLCLDGEKVRYFTETCPKKP